MVERYGDIISVLFVKVWLSENEALLSILLPKRIK
jgi:hypothetical protein